MKLFVSYRAKDLDEVERLHDRLAEAFGTWAVVRDLGRVPFDARRAEYVRDWLSTTAVVLVVIGPSWLAIADRTGRQRLRRRDDPVRLEIEAALALRIPLLPVLVGGASLPAAKALPRSLRALCRWQAYEVRPGPHHDADLARLVSEIERVQDLPPHPVSRLKVEAKSRGVARWWEARFHLGSEHSVRYELLQHGIRPTRRFVVDGKLVWSAKAGWRSLPSIDLPFRIEAENACCWLVTRDNSNALVYTEWVVVWIDETRIQLV
jgi:hypothetical protein